MEKEKIYVFIDSQNLNVSIIEQGWKLDFKIFYKYLVTKFKVEKVFLFIGFVKKNDYLYRNLKKIGYILMFKPIIITGNNCIKGNIDTDLVLCAMVEFNNYDKAIIVSGDGDFYCLLNYLCKSDKLLRLIIPNKYKYSSLLREFRKYFLYIDDLEDKLKKW